MNKQPDRNPRKALGKGLSALLPGRATGVQRAKEEAPPEVSESGDSNASMIFLPLDVIQAGEDQPRESFDQERLEELARSIKANGLIQPITVFRTDASHYTIIAGERRWRAARIAGLTEIPAYIRIAEPSQLLEMALVENLQREDLNPLEVAHGFHRLLVEYGMSHEQIAERTGKDRSTVTNFLRLLRLTPEVSQELVRGHISVGHARALLNITSPDEQIHACQEIITKKLSVRETETLVKRLSETSEARPRGQAKDERPADPNVRAALSEMSAVLGTRVRLSGTGKKGKIEIDFYSQDDLDRIYSIIVRQSSVEELGAGGRS